METVLPLASLFLIGFFLLWTILDRKKQSAEATKLTQELQNQFSQTTEQLFLQLDRQQTAHSQNSYAFHTRLDNATKIFNEVQGKLGQIENSNKQLFELGKDISSLQNVLRAPKMRGNLGEVWLAEIISQILPSHQFKLQYRFKNGEVCDAAVFLRDNTILPIDAKFSLENFSRIQDAEEAEKKVHSRAFASDVKKRIDEIATKYIQPGEGTLDIALMYIPAENVYYHAFIQDQENLHLLDYAFSKKVIPVSPSSFYSYLQVILFGLRGMEIEKSAKIIQQNLTGLKTEIDKFHDIHSKVGTHLRHAQASFEIADKKLSHVEYQVDQITTIQEPLLEDTHAPDNLQL